LVIIPHTCFSGKLTCCFNSYVEAATRIRAEFSAAHPDYVYTKTPRKHKKRKLATEAEMLRAEQEEADIRKRQAEQAIELENLQQTVRVNKSEMDKLRLEYNASETQTDIQRQLLKLSLDEAEAKYKQSAADIADKKAGHTAEVKILQYTLLRHTRHRDRHSNDVKAFSVYAAMDGLVVMQQIWRGRPAVVTRNAAGGPNLNAGGYGYGLRVSQSCRFDHIVAHSGGLPGFGSLMQWLPDYGVGIIAFGNVTYTGWGGVVSNAFDLLAKTGGLQRRMPQPSPTLVAARVRHRGRTGARCSARDFFPAAHQRRVAGVRRIPAAGPPRVRSRSRGQRRAAPAASPARRRRVQPLHVRRHGRTAGLEVTVGFGL
jgi:hypothetical protein